MHWRASQMQAAANESVRGMSPSTQRRAAGEVLSGVTKDDPMVRPEGTQFPAVLAQEAKGEIEQMIPAHIRGMTTLGEIATDMLDRIHPDTFDELLHFADPATTGRKYTRATREAGRRHTDYTVNVDAYEALMTGGFVDRSKVPPVGGKKYLWVGIEGDRIASMREPVQEITLREIHQQIWKDPTLGNEWARQWGLNHVHGAYGAPWQWTIPHLGLGRKGAGFDPQRAAVNSVRLARIWSTTPAIANRFRRPGMDNSVFQEIMLFIGWRDQTLWKQSIQGATPPALGPLVQITPTQLDDIDTLISISNSIQTRFITSNIRTHRKTITCSI